VAVTVQFSSVRYTLKNGDGDGVLVTVCDSLHIFCKQPIQPDFHFKISGFLVAIKLKDKSGYPDLQTLILYTDAEIGVCYSQTLTICIVILFSFECFAV